MQTTYLQSLIATNAASIRARQSYISDDLAEARAYAAAGEKAFAIDSYKCADRCRVKLVKLVATQRALKTELAANHRLARIDRKIAKLQTVGFVYEAPGVLTSREIENALDDLIDVFVPKKADTRPDTFGL